MAKASTQHKLDRVRPPRVHITYDVEIGDAIELKELPFVMGVLGDFTGQPEAPLPRLRDRKFVEVNPDNYQIYMQAGLMCGYLKDFAEAERLYRAAATRAPEVAECWNNLGAAQFEQGAFFGDPEIFPKGSMSLASA